jgi:hypothetical protein
MPRPNPLHLLPAIILLATLAGTRPATAAADSPAAQTNNEVTLAGQTFSVELATTLAQRARGLMFRASMPANHGMLFLFPQPRPMAFWMKNTAMPLDILFFDQQSRLIAAYYNVPPCRSTPCPQYSSGKAAAMVLELNGGRGKSLGLTNHDTLAISDAEKLPRPQ